jgi:MOSC domain-containing protein YiiM
MIKSLYVAEQRRGEQQAAPEIRLIANRGIVGDRNFDKSKWPGQNITFVEAEEIARYNGVYGQAIAEHATRRNVVTEGVRLNDLLGREFSVGGVRLRGVELCEPCAVLGELLSNQDLAKKDVVKAWVGRGGLRADVLSDGILAVGMRFDLSENA